MRSRARTVFAALWAVGSVACTAEVRESEPRSEAERYVQDVSFRRNILEEDLLTFDNEYAQDRLALYAIEGEGWEALPERDPPSVPLTFDEVDRIAAGERLTVDAAQATTLVPAELPTADADWVALGRRVFFEYPLRADSVHEAILQIPDALRDVGFLEDEGEVVGLRAFVGEFGLPHIGQTCAQCHASRDADGEITGQMANREMNIGAARLLALGFVPGELPPEIDSTAVGDLDRLGPGRNDVLPDGKFNPYAIPDFAGIADMPYLHHNANWHHRTTATLAVRCETLFITSAGELARIPRVLSYALAMYFRSLPAPPPLEEPSVEASRGEDVFTAAGCPSCHVPPLFTSDQLIRVEDIGTEPSAGLSRSRFTGYYRIASLRGVGRAAPYLHHGVFDSLEAMFDPGRDEPGHEYGLELGDEDRAALIAYLRSL